MTVSRKVVAWLCALALLAALAPMVVIASKNHLFYDDLGYAVETRAAWLDTGSVAEVVRVGMETALQRRLTWGGIVTASFLTAVEPAVFDEALYGWTTYLLLAFLLLGVGFAAWTFLRDVLGADRSATVAIVCLALLLCTQFLPNAREAFFWFNGGFNYTFIASMFYLSLGVTVKLWRAKRTLTTAALTAVQMLLLLLVGGGGYPPALLALCSYVLLTLFAFRVRHPRRYVLAGLTVWLAVFFLLNCTAPGNAVRAATLNGGVHPAKAVAEAIFFGVALLGDFFSLPVLALCLLAVALLWSTLRQCAFSFKHPLPLTLALLCLFCAQLAPTIYTGNYLGDGRARDTYYYAYVATTLLLTLYWAGWLAKRGGVRTASDRLKLAPVLLAALLLIVGCVAYHPEGAASYGPQNMTGGSALRSLVSGQAERYDQAMDAREALLNDPTQPEVALPIVRDAPAVFMSDALASPQAEYARRLYAEYYRKNEVTIIETE